jgi:hypothetical protein
VSPSYVFDWHIRGGWSRSIGLIDPIKLILVTENLGLIFFLHDFSQLARIYLIYPEVLAA